MLKPDSDPLMIARVSPPPKVRKDAGIWWWRIKRRCHRRCQCASVNLKLVGLGLVVTLDAGGRAFGLAPELVRAERRRMPQPADLQLAERETSRPRRRDDDHVAAFQSGFIGGGLVAMTCLDMTALT